MLVIDNNSFPYYVIFITLSIIAGLIYMYLNIKKISNNKNVYLYLVMFLVFSLFFGKLFGYLCDIKNTNIITSGLSSYGGLFGIILASIIFEYIMPLDKKLIKLSIIVLPLMYSIGKIGCLLQGCCYGIEYNGFLSINYINSSVSYFPVQLVEAVVFLIIFIIANKYKNKNNIVPLTILICSLAKFLLDFLRYEHNIFSLTNIFGIILIVISIILIIRGVIHEKK